jgi:hypothetical protein
MNDRFHTRKTSLLALLCVGATVSLAACSSGAKQPSSSAAASPAATTATTVKAAPSGAPSTASGGPNPCDLLTTDQVAAVLGGPVTVAGPTEANRGKNCVFSLSDKSGPNVLVQVYKGAEFYSPSAQATAPETIPGVGDRSYLDSPDGQPRSTGYVKGDTVVFVSVMFANPTKDQLVGLTKDTLTKLG